MLRSCLLLLLLGLFAREVRADENQIVLRFGSKKFTESVILGEMLTHLARSADVSAIHQKEMQGTRVVWQALTRGDVDAYPEYTGTILREILSKETIESDEGLRKALEERGIGISRPLGFNNTYALGMREEVASSSKISKISDLLRHPDLEFGLTEEFIDRADGWPSLAERYGLPHKVVGLDHDIAYVALMQGDYGVVDLYSTDAEIEYYGLRVLEDDLGHFPRYDAVILYRLDLAERAPAALAALLRLEGSIDAVRMVGLNRRSKIDKVAENSVAAQFLARELGVEVETVEETWRTRLLRNTIQHLYLVAVSLLAAILIAVPLGVLAARKRVAGAVILGVTGVIQTIPALALLVFMIPLLGTREPPALMALFLYSLLPIVRNTHAGLTGIAPELQESARALGLPAGARLRRVELPLAMPTILTGIKISAVINVGTATLGALIGAGGYGQEILTGIRLDDTLRILEGAVPSAALAVVVQVGFSGIERWVVPAGIR